MIATIHELKYASLLVAAQDLLEACEALAEANGETLEHAIILANDAIAKAKGE